MQSYLFIANQIHKTGVSMSRIKTKVDHAKKNEVELAQKTPLKNNDFFCAE
jgi:hypothetical protein